MDLRHNTSDLVLQEFGKDAYVAYIGGDLIRGGEGRRGRRRRRNDGYGSMDGLLRFYGDERQTEENGASLFRSKSTAKANAGVLFYGTRKEKQKSAKKKSAKKGKKKKRAEKQKQKEEENRINNESCGSGLARMRNKTVVYGKVLYI